MACEFHSILVGQVSVKSYWLMSGSTFALYCCQIFKASVIEEFKMELIYFLIIPLSTHHSICLLSIHWRVMTTCIWLSAHLWGCFWTFTSLQSVDIFQQNSSELLITRSTGHQRHCQGPWGRRCCQGHAVKGQGQAATTTKSCELGS